MSLLILRHWFVKQSLPMRAQATLLCLLIVICDATNLRAQTPDENQVKAVFIYNFTHFVKWPSSAFANSGAPFIIGIVGDKVGSFVEETIEGESMDGHPIRVRYVNDPRDAVECHLVFIEQSRASVTRKIMGQLKGKPVLTVSDAADFMGQSGIIRLYNENNKIRLEINQKASEDSNLEISAKLLRLATIYKK